MESTEEGELSMRKRKCKAVYDLMRKKHMKFCEIKDNDGNTKTTEYLWCSSARDIEVELNQMVLLDEITSDEYTYIFGMICSSAISFAKGDFFR